MKKDLYQLYSGYTKKHSMIKQLTSVVTIASEKQVEEKKNIKMSQRREEDKNENK